MARVISSLKDVNPAIGAKVIVEFNTPKRKVICELIGFSEGKSLFVSCAKRFSNSSSTSFEGKSVKVHIMQQGRVCTFLTTIKKVMPEPYLFWDLVYPEKIEVSDIRKNTRVDLNLPVAIEYQDTSLGLSRDIPNIVFCRDISLEGLAIEAPVPLGVKGDEFFITKRLKIAGTDQMLLTSVVLKSVKVLETGVQTHGFKFVDIVDENQILIAAYVYKQVLVDLGYIED